MERQEREREAGVQTVGELELIEVSTSAASVRPTRGDRCGLAPQPWARVPVPHRGGGLCSWAQAMACVGEHPL